MKLARWSMVSGDRGEVDEEEEEVVVVVAE